MLLVSLISYIDLSQGKRAIVGLTTGVHTISDGTEVSNASTDSTSEKKVDRDRSAIAEKKSDKSKKTDRRNR